MSLLNKKDNLTEPEYIVKFSLLYLNMRKIKEESVEKIMASDENQ
jgi:hypothetical protein